MRLEDFDFRIWDNRTKKYFYAQNEGLHFMYKLKATNIQECEIELWSGLVDRDGNKIYEGDIVSEIVPIGLDEVGDLYSLVKFGKCQIFEKGIIRKHKKKEKKENCNEIQEQEKLIGFYIKNFGTEKIRRMPILNGYFKIESNIHQNEMYSFYKKEIAWRDTK